MNLLKRLIFLLMLAGCGKPACFEAAGPVEKVARPLSTFTRISLKDNIHLVLTQDTVERMVVEAGRYLQQAIATTITDGVLTIENKAACPWLRHPGEQITVYVSVKKLEQVDYNGSGNVTSTNTLTADRLFFYSYEGAGNINVAMQAQVGGAYIHHENADITLSGSSARFLTYTNARGSLNLKDLVVKDMVIEYGGVRNATINVTEKLDAIIYHTGHLYYKGEPQVKLQTHSSGRLLKLP